jgi:hypothetical protein
VSPLPLVGILSVPIPRIAATLNGASRADRNDLSREATGSGLGFPVDLTAHARAQFRLMNMKQRVTLLRLCLVIAAILTTTFGFAGTHGNFQSGKLLDVSSDERLYEGTSLRNAIYQVQVGDVIYSARGERLRRRSGDAGHGLIVGDSIQVAIDGDSLFLLRPDGKEIKAKIVKRQRADAK